MPRSNWKGNITFGLVSIPVVLYNSIDPSSKVSFKQINLKTGAPIQYKRIDAESGKEVPWEQIGRGYQYARDTLLPVKEGELEKVAGENAHTIAIDEFIDKKNIDFINVDKTYYLVPDKKAEKAYVILREALKEAGKAGIAKVIISTKEYLAAVMPYGDALVLYIMHYAEQIKDINEFDIPSGDLKKYKIKQPEIAMAKKLISTMSKKWKPEKYKDEYREAVDKWVEAKAKHVPGHKMPPRSHAKTTTNMVDFVALLKKSLKETGAESRKKPGKQFARRTSHGRHSRAHH